MRTALAMVLLLTTLGGCSGPPAPDGPTPSPGTLELSGQSASLLRRLAEAADGFRDGEDRFIVAALEFPHEVVRQVVTTREAAESIATARSTETQHFMVFGPVNTPVDSVAGPHPKDVISVTVLMRDKTTKTYSADSVDALFWGLPAFDKFVAPYLTQVGDAEYAGVQRRLYRQGISPLQNSQVIPHYRSSF
jgi:hypothetical protein